MNEEKAKDIVEMISQCVPILDAPVTIIITAVDGNIQITIKGEDYNVNASMPYMDAVSESYGNLCFRYEEKED